MLRALFAVSLAATLAGCASAPKPQVGGAHVKSAPAKPGPVAKAAPVEAAPTTFKERWYDRFMRHKSK